MIRPHTVSVVLATFNGARYLKEQLQSIGRQTLVPYELVISDDGSSDDTLQIAKAFATSSTFPVRIYQNAQRLGYAQNFLRAAPLCSGDVLAFCDQDDVWIDSKLETCLDALHSTGALLCIHSGRVVDERLVPLGYTLPSYRRRHAISRHHADPYDMPPGFAMVFRRELLTYGTALNKLPASSQFIRDGTERPMTHDEYIWFLASCLGSTVFLPNELVMFRRHATTRTRFAHTRPPSRASYARASVAGSFLQSTRQAHLARSRSALLRSASSPPSLRARLFAEAAEYYDQLEQVALTRSIIYVEGTTLPNRVANLLRLLKRTGWTRKKGLAYRSASFAQDVLVTLLSPSTLLRLLGWVGLREDA